MERKHVWIWIVTGILALPLCQRTNAQYGGGSGTPDDPYLIYTAEQMNTIARHGPLSGHFKLMADIDLAACDMQYAIGHSLRTPFRVNFDGNNHAISSLEQGSLVGPYAGLFGVVDDPNAEIRNLRLVDPNIVIQRDIHIGALVGRLENGVVRNCTVEGGRICGVLNCGGLVGYSQGRIIDCHASCSVSGSLYIGGLVGWNCRRDGEEEAASLFDSGCLVSCSAAGEVSGIEEIGGLVGYNAQGTVNQCEATGDVSGREHVGGLVGQTLAGVFEECRATGFVSGELAVGGFIGSTQDASLTECDATGVVDGNNCTGGLLGYNSHGTLTNCSAMGAVSGSRYVGGLVGYNCNDFSVGESETVLANCRATGHVTGDACIGGLVGDISCSVLTSCSATGNTAGNDVVGGLIGDADDIALKSCYATGDVIGGNTVGGLMGRMRGGNLTQCYATGNTDGGNSVGGLVGSSGGTAVTDIGNCHASGATTGSEKVGGLVGNSHARLTNCYATGNVGGISQVGGLVGFQGSRSTKTNSPIVACYSSGKVTGESDIGGLVGRSTSITTAVASFWDIERSGQIGSATGAGKTTAQMRAPQTFIAAGWDFIEIDEAPCDIWAVDPISGYPLLWWQVPDAPLPSFDGGDGSEETPYRIASAEQLNDIGHNPRLMNACFELVTDIDLTGVHCFAIGNETFPFSGRFQGHGWAISHLSDLAQTGNHVGLFGILDGPEAEINGLCLIDPNISAKESMHVGALVGRVEDGMVCMCGVWNGTVTGNQYVGGLIGSNGNGTIAYCLATCRVSGCESSDVQEEQQSSGGDRVGGLVGENNQTIAHCYATGPVSGPNNVGGLVGSNYHIVTKCYATGVVRGNGNTGGLIGYGDHDGTGAIASFWDIEASGQASSNGGKGRMTAQMQTADTFLRWGTCGYEGIWTIDEGTDYPRLWWEHRSGQPIEMLPLSDYLDGSGSVEDPFLIHTSTEMNRIGLFPCDWDKHFVLMADIDLGEYPESQFNLIGEITIPFSGTFDGQGHTIDHFSYNSSDQEPVGLFVHVSGAAAEIKNIVLIDPNVAAGPNASYCGALIAYVDTGSVIECAVENGRIAGYDAVGALVGYNNSASLRSCHSTSNTSGNKCVGGLLGYNHRGAITDCNAVTIVSGGDYIGGLIGYNYVGNITNCRSDGQIEGNDVVGGLLGGTHDGMVRACRSACIVSGNEHVGGSQGSAEQILATAMRPAVSQAFATLLDSSVGTMPNTMMS